MAGATFSGKFGSLKFENIVGYLVQVAFTPGMSTGGDFNVYLLEQMDITKKPETPVEMEYGKLNPRDSLQFKDADRQYQFDKIDLISADVMMTSTARLRLFEFKYDVEEIDKASTSPVQPKNLEKPVKPGDPEEYRYAVAPPKAGPGDPEQLIGFRTLLGQAGGAVLRFTAKTSEKNHFLKLMCDLIANQSKAEKMEKFSINFAQQALDLQHDDVTLVVVEEAQGWFRQIRPPDLVKVLGGWNRGRSDVVLRPHSPGELLRAFGQQHTMVRKETAQAEYAGLELGPSSVQTLTVVLNRTGQYTKFKFK